MRDAAVCGFLFAGTLGYLYYWPRDFYAFDEGMYLYEAKRVLDGEVMYRDFFQILTPLWFYLVAVLYALFGVTLDTARMGMAVVHGGIGVLTYLICRSGGVRRTVAMLAALPHLAIGYPQCSIATPHWFSTFLALILLLQLMRHAVAAVPRAFVVGVLAGVLFLVQQHRGVVMAAAIVVVALLDHRLQPAPRRDPLWRVGASGFAGFLVIVVPVLLAFVAVAGLDNVLRPLVWHPLSNYTRIPHTGRASWDLYLSVLSGRLTPTPEMAALVPLGFVSAYLPLVVLPLGAVAALLTRTPGTRRRSLLVLLIFSTVGWLSIAYNADPVHLAFVVPVWAALAALLLEMMLGILERPAPVVRAVATALVLLVISGAGWQLRETLRFRRNWFSLPTETAFGRVDFSGQGYVDFFFWMRDLLEREEAREVFTYPSGPGLYLLTGTKNPTRYQILVPDYTDRDQLEEVVRVLESRQVRFVLRAFYWGSQKLEPLHSYVNQNYERLVPPFAAPNPPVIAPLTVFRRRAEPPSKDKPLP